MSEQIDWSKAPADATHCWAQAQDFFKLDHGNWMVWYGHEMRWAKSTIAERWNSLVERQTTPSWPGEGLPPVGVACMANGYQVVIVAHHCNGIHAIYAESEVDGLLYYGEPNEFRPIRTPEQIAADEREEAISEITQFFMNYYGDPKGAEKYFLVSRSLYDAGFRKP